MGVPTVSLGYRPAQMMATDILFYHVSAEECMYQSQLCMKLHIFGMERAVFFFYVMLFTAVGK